MSDLHAPRFKTEKAGRKHLEAIRWPNGPICPHCGSVNNASVTDAERADKALKGIAGKRLTYRRPDEAANA